MAKFLRLYLKISIDIRKFFCIYYFFVSLSTTSILKDFKNKKVY
ncbi:hypothetical protein FOXB_04433 [Fusarium oxysporum f. sp. conglutinans Fo5176]|uniref:Uncharacterized protein n=1 Tax=Fusarium oxysporum (strain Fo5176) TaxID=660025 RepID=F9FDF5_FUSOF|nr:hypothetical protein FOXB_04433 [Fusarium oxysporum f. sp. conglutinans Fo5176]